VLGYVVKALGVGKEVCLRGVYGYAYHPCEKHSTWSVSTYKVPEILWFVLFKLAK
jgi:hypothetical protein